MKVQPDDLTPLQGRTPRLAALQIVVILQIYLRPKPSEGTLRTWLRDPGHTFRNGQARPIASPLARTCNDLRINTSKFVNRRTIANTS